MLETFVEDFEDLSEERDVEILVLTLSGIVNQNYEQLEKAKELSGKTSNYQDRRKWLIIPKITI